MSRVVENEPIEKDQRLVRPASSHIEPTRDIGGGLYAGEELEAPDRIALRKPRHRRQRSRAHAHEPRLEAAIAGETISGDRHLIEHDRTRS